MHLTKETKPTSKCKYSNTSKKKPKQPITFKVTILLWSIIGSSNTKVLEEVPEASLAGFPDNGIMALLEDSGFQFRMGNKTLTVLFMFLFFFGEGCDKQKERLANPLWGFFIPTLWFWGFWDSFAPDLVGTYSIIIRPLALPISRG